MFEQSPGSGGRRAQALRQVAALLATLGLIVVSIAATSAGDTWVLVVPIALNSLLVISGLTGQRRQSTISPLDLFLLIVFVHGCVVPGIDVLFGRPEIYRAGSTTEGALRIALLSFVFSTCVVAGWYLIVRPTRRTWGQNRPVSISPVVALTLVGLGLAGLLVRVPHSLAQLREPGWLLQSGGVGPIALFGTLAAPLLPVGTFLLLSHIRAPAIKLLLGPTLTLASLVAMVSFSLNRAAILIPILAMVITRTRFAGKGVGPLQVLGLVAVGFTIFLYVGQARSSLMYDELGVEAPTQQSNGAYALTSLQVYFQSPFLTGILLDQQPKEFDASSFISSVMAPVPRLGREFRGETGTSVYNDLIYGGAAHDQILPTWAEVYLSFGLPVLIMFGLAMGVLLRRIGDRLAVERDPLRLYAFIFMAMWLAQMPIVSVLVLSQISIYFAAPVLFIGWLISLKLRRPEDSFSVFQDADYFGDGGGSAANSRF